MYQLPVTTVHVSLINAVSKSFIVSISILAISIPTTIISNAPHRSVVKRNSPPLWQRHLEVFRDSSRQDPMIADFAQRIPKDSQNAVMIKKAVLTLLLASCKIKKLGPRPVF